jgi:hypothetical protein
MDWIPPSSNPGNGRGDPPPVADQLNGERSHALVYKGATKESRITLPANSNGYHSMPTPMFTPAVKAHLLSVRTFNYALNQLRPTAAGGPLLATSENSCCSVWVGVDRERTTVQYAQGKGQLRVKAGTLLYDGEFDQGFRHGQGVSLVSTPRDTMRVLSLSLSFDV